MNTPNDGGPAFPASASVKRHNPVTGETIIEPITSGGMSLRDWFAGQALASMTVAPDYSKGPCNHAMAERAYCIADAMLKARNKEVAQ